MIGAMEIGDFSWRVEELFNSLIENRIHYTHPSAMPSSWPLAHSMS